MLRNLAEVQSQPYVSSKKTDVPSSTFAIPVGFKMIEMPKLDPNLAASGSAGANGASGAKTDVNVDSIANAAKEGAKEGVKENAQTDAKEAAKNAAAGATKKLKGIFKH